LSGHFGTEDSRGPIKWLARLLLLPLAVLGAWAIWPDVAKHPALAFGLLGSSTLARLAGELIARAIETRTSQQQRKVAGTVVGMVILLAALQVFGRYIHWSAYDNPVYLGWLSLFAGWYILGPLVCAKALRIGLVEL
jgi:hypothetical protein